MLSSGRFLLGVSLGCWLFFACRAVTAPTAGSDVVVSRDQFGTTITVSLGQTLAIPRPMDFEEWQVDFASEVLELLTPADKRRSPGPDGWRFRAVGAGETDVALTAVTGAGAAPPRFVVTIRVTR